MRSCSLVLLLLIFPLHLFASGPSKEQVSAGRQVFATAGCAHCHGADAQGGEVGPSLLDVGRRLKPEDIEKQVRNGGNVMPAFGDALNGDQIANLVAYLRTQRAKTPKKPVGQ